MELSLVEKFLLLAQHPVKGKFVISGIHIQYGIIGSLLLKMSLDNRLVLDNNYLKLATSKTQSDALIEEIESQIRKSPKPRKINRWVNMLSRKSNKFKKQLLKQLSNKGIIIIKQRRFLGVIPYKSHYLVNKRKRDELIQRIKTEILSTKKIDGDHLVLMGLVEATKMHGILSTDKAELKKIRIRLKEIIKESPIADSVSKTIQQVQAAIFVSITATTVAASSSH